MMIHDNKFCFPCVLGALGEKYLFFYCSILVTNAPMNRMVLT